MRRLSAAAIVTRGERIAWVGAEDALPTSLRSEVTHSHDLRGAWVTPALIDCHTHLVFAGTRAAEYGDRLRGVTYEAIARRGGGILTTVRAVRAASEQQLFDESAPRLAALLAEGVTTVEVKSGYGLTREDEAKMLRVARQLAAQFPVRIRTSYLAAHALPPEYAGRADEYIELVARQWLPELHAAGLIDAVDVYCDSIAFTVAQAERVLSAAAALQLPVKVHAEQLANIGASRLAARCGALSADHLEHAGAAEAEALARAGTVAVLLPVAFYCLSDKQLPPIAELRTAGTAIALASDCNPGSAPGTSLLLALNMGMRLFGLTPEEALAGVTRHAARALGLQDDLGQVAPGYLAELAVWDIETPEELGYWIGYNRCRAVIRGGALHAAAAASGPWTRPSK
jgi:imidazolonepropionase